MKDMILIAKIGKTHGIQGKLNLQILSHSVDRAISYHPWYIENQKTKKWSIIEKKCIENLGKKILIKFQEINTKEQASLLTNSFIAIEKNKLDYQKKDEFYWFELVGLNVINQKQNSFGQVKSIINTKANEVLICKRKKREFLIPFINKYIKSINKSKNIIIVDWEYNY